MSSPNTQPGEAQPTSAEKAGESGLPSGLPDARRLQAQLASLAEGPLGIGSDGASFAGVGELRPLLEFLRTMLSARALGLFPLGGNAPFPTTVVTTRGILASSLAALVEPLDPREATVLPAPALGPDAYTIGIPIFREGAPFAWLLAQISVPSPRDLQAFVALLQSLSGFLLYLDQRRRTGETHWALERSSSLLDLFRRAATEPDHAKASRIAVDGLRDYFAATRVHLGIRRRDGLRVRALSGVAHVDAKSPAHQAVEAAMRESFPSRDRLDFHAETPRSADTVAHELLLQQTGAARLSTLPFPKKRGAVLIAWDTAPDPAQTALVAAAAPLLPALFDLLERARPNPLLFAARQTWERWTENRRRVATLAAGAVIVLLGWPFPYSIRADCRLAPTIKRVIAAPFEGTLKKSFVRPGDPVTAGQPLAEMDNRELKLKEGELLAARERSLKQRDKAMSNEGEGADFAAAQLATLEAQSISRELDLVQRRLASLAIQAPLAGVVVSGDLRRAEGQPVQQGQVLFEIAPLAEMILEIDVPDREISRLATGQPARFRLEAFAGETLASAIEKIHPQSEQRDGRNVFIAEASVRHTARPLELRPGMRGRAVIQADRRPLIWILGHRLWDFTVETLFW